MSLIKLIPKNSVLNTAINLINKSKKTLNMTMIMEDELNSFSPDYIRLLKSKIAKGVMIQRIGFGSKKQYQQALQQLSYLKLPKNFIFIYCPQIAIAQRLLISDEKEMLFAVYTDKKNKLVFYTKSKEVINGFLNYFNKYLRISKKI